MIANPSVDKTETIIQLLTIESLNMIGITNIDRGVAEANIFSNVYHIIFNESTVNNCFII